MSHVSVSRAARFVISDDPRDLSAEGERFRSQSRFPLRSVRHVDDADDLRARTARMNTMLEEHVGERGPSADARPSGRSPLREPLWAYEEVANGATTSGELARLWIDRVTAWERAHACALVRTDQDYEAIWRALPSGEFDGSCRGRSYTTAMNGFHVARWNGALTLLWLATERAACGCLLDVLGGDGYLRRIAAATAADFDGPPLWNTDTSIFTNDRSAHMFVHAGTWGVCSRESAESLDRTFHQASCDAVLFAYGTHHIASFVAAARQASHVLKPGGTVVVHDFLPGGKVAEWFRVVVDRFGLVRHDHPHLGPIEMRDALTRAGFVDLDVYEMSDPFIFTAIGDLSACAVAERHIQTMYGLNESMDAGAVHAAVDAMLTYPELGDVPVWTDDYVCIPRRAIVARAVKRDETAGASCES